MILYNKNIVYFVINNIIDKFLDHPEVFFSKNHWLTWLHLSWTLVTFVICYLCQELKWNDTAQFNISCHVAKIFFFRPSDESSIIQCRSYSLTQWFQNFLRARSSRIFKKFSAKHKILVCFAVGGPLNPVFLNRCINAQMCRRNRLVIFIILVIFYTKVCRNTFFQNKSMLQAQKVENHWIK